MASVYSAIVMVAMALCTEMCAGAATKDIVSKKLRGGHIDLRHIEQADADDDDEDDDDDDEEQTGDAQEMAPLYDDFLDVMNHAASKALEEQRAIPAYQDFLNLMKHSADKAYKEQAGAPDYDDFLGFMNTKAGEAQKQDMPSYDDFLTALKASSVEALKTPVPSYEDFLHVLKDGAEKAMQKREHHEGWVNGDAVQVTSHENPVDGVSKELNENIVVSENPLDKVRDALGKATNTDRTKKQIEGKKTDDDDTDALEKELKSLKEAKKNSKGSPDHVKKPIMNRINVLRTQLCWKRPNLWQHEKCLRFLGLHCMEESTGEGICKAFTKKAKEKCESEPDSNDFKADYCALSEALGETYGDDDVEEEEDEEEENILDDKDGVNDDGGDVDKDGHNVGSDKDLEEDLEEHDEVLGVKEKKEAVVEEENEKVADKDGDGVPDSEDAFPDDPNEWKDTDKDGIGDNADDDIDGDGHKNEDDLFPHDPKEWLDSDNDGIGDNADKDRDNDGVENDKDKFPDDPTEWADSDKDGVGDNKDAYPYNPNCHDPTLSCDDVSKSGVPKPGSPDDPVTLDKDARRPLPSQGFNEHMNGPKVAHSNYYTYVGDWQEEFPEMQLSEKNTMAAICKEHPDNSWCYKFRNHDAHFR